MYENGYEVKTAAMQDSLTAAKCVQPPTIRENIERQIDSHQAAIARLVATRDRLEKSNLLDVKISDLREAMMF